MSTLQEVIEEVSQHCDLTERLTLVPPSAKVRGIYFWSIVTALEKAGRLEAYRALFPEKLGTLAWHPADTFLVHLAAGAALLTSPERVHEGMFEIGRCNAVAFSSSLIGRMLMRMLSRDPQKLLQQGLAARRQSYSAGRWELSFPEERRAVMLMFEEYLYIESYMLGAARGTFDAIGIPVRAECELESRFQGKHILSW